MVISCSFGHVIYLRSRLFLPSFFVLNWTDIQPGVSMFSKSSRSKFLETRYISDVYYGHWVQDTWFQQYGGLAHSTSTVRDLLDCANRVIRRSFVTSFVWPFRNLDLFQLNFCFWGYGKIFKDLLKNHRRADNSDSKCDNGGFNIQTRASYRDFFFTVSSTNRDYCMGTWGSCLI